MGRRGAGDAADGPEARSQLVSTAGGDLTDLARRFADSFLGRCVRRFIDMAGIDRSMVLASQAFTSMIPLLILVATWAPADKDNVIAESIISKFHLEGDAASAVTQLFAVPEGATGTVSTFSALLLLISGTSFTRRFQRMYRSAYEQPKAGFEAITGCLAFYAAKVDEAWVGGEQATPQAGGFYGGWMTSAIVGPVKGEPGSSGW